MFYYCIVVIVKIYNCSGNYAKLNYSRKTKMHILQPKHTILKQKEADELLKKYNVSPAQLPKIKITDPALPEGANIGDIIKIERKNEENGEKSVYFRVVVA